jgi:hypothetical protein
MRYPKFLPVIVAAICLFGCNPNCENIVGVYFAEHAYAEDSEILIKASDLNSLRSRMVFFDDIPAESTTFVEGTGLVAKMPEGVKGENVKMRIQDRDCGDFVTRNLAVQPDDYFVGNPNYIPPAPPQIIIAIPNPPLPPNINNAWISPNNTDYCIWFVVDPVPGSPGNFLISPVERPNPGNPNVMIRSQELSVEQQVCGQSPSEDTNLYHRNPIYGMINTEGNVIQFWIDRSAKDLGIEEFAGGFLDIDQTPYGDERTPDCGNWNKEKKHMMMVTSKQTGRTLLLYQQLPL